jgi:MoaA/NifB/PqqE/SkfB family radical SAM enzyme
MGDPPPGSAAPLALAPRADLKVGFACNNKCVFCAQGTKRSECGSIPLGELLRRLEQVKDHTHGLVLTGGEPTLYKPLVDLVRAARAMGFTQVQIQTNGRMLAYPRVLAALVGAGATEFSPSLHGSRPEIHDRLTRARGSWRETLGGIRNLCRMGATVITNSVITCSNVHDLPRLVALLGRVGVVEAQLAFVHPVGTALEMFDEVVPRLPDVVEPLRQARAVAGRLGMRLVAEAMPYCFMRGLEDMVVEDAIPDTTVVDLNGQIENYSRWRVVEGKSHGPPCEGCAMQRRCEGPWREYPERYGWDEFVPLPAAGR